MESKPASAWCLRLLLDRPHLMGDLKSRGIRERHIIDQNHKAIWVQIEHYIDPSTGILSDMFTLGLNSPQRNALNEIRHMAEVLPFFIDKIVDNLKREYQWSCYRRAVNLIDCELSKDIDERKTIDEMKRDIEILIDSADLGDEDIFTDLVTDVFPRMMKEISDRLTTKASFNTGFECLDYYLDGGVTRGAFMIFAGPTSVGKTAAITQVMMAFLMQRLRVVMIGLEMEDTEYANRGVSHYARILGVDGLGQGAMRRPLERSFDFDTAEAIRKDWEKNEFSNKYLKTKSITVSELKKVFHRAYDIYKADVIMLDHTLLVQADDAREPQHISLGKIANFMKAFAAENKIITIAVSQVTREATNSKSKKEKTSTSIIAGSRDLENAATILIGIIPHEPEPAIGGGFAANPTASYAEIPGREMKEFHIIKNRTGIKHVYFRAKYIADDATFEEVMPSNWQEIRSMPPEPIRYY